MDTLDKLKPLIKKTIFSSAQARKVGVSSGLLPYYVKKGLIKKIGHGLYQGSDVTLDVDFQWEDLVLAYKTVRNGVICLTSALSLYNLTEEIAREHWIAVRNSTTVSKKPHVKIVRMRNIKTGLTTLKLGSETLRIFDIERTVIDSFRYLSIETALKALKTALNEKKINLLTLQKYCKTLRVNLNPYVLALTTP